MCAALKLHRAWSGGHDMVGAYGGNKQWQNAKIAARAGMGVK